MSKKGSFEYEMDKVARMVLTVIHIHKEKFNIKLLDNGYTERDIAESIYQLFGYKFNTIHLHQLVVHYPDVFESNVVYTDTLMNTIIIINKEYADALEIW